MATKKPRKGSKPKDITLHDVMAHMTDIEQRLSTKIEQNSKDIVQNSSDIRRVETNLSNKIDGVEQALTNRIDALEEDLMAVMKDTIKIRRHVGMAVPNDD
jgi:predicted  nucleic acid-binding Zn-ribbon protein